MCHDNGTTAGYLCLQVHTTPLFLCSVCDCMLGCPSGRESESPSGPSSQLRPPRLERNVKTIIQSITRPEPLFGHVFSRDTGFLVTFTAQQARLRRPNARHN